MQWIKQCECKGTSTKGNYLHKNIPSKDGVTVRVIYHPGPVCDECETPWELERKDNIA